MKGLLVAAIVLAGLAGLLFWSDRHKPEENSSPDSEPTVHILALKQDDITKVDIKRKAGDETMVAKDGSGKWQITGPKPFHADDAAFSSVLSTLASLDANRVIEDKATDLSTYGLSTPLATVTIQEKDGKTQKLLLGDPTPTKAANYAALEGDPRVFAIAGYNATGLNKSTNDLLDKRILPIDSVKISAVEIVTGNSDIVFGQKDGAWQIQKPQTLRADDSQVQSLINALLAEKFDPSRSADDTKKAAAAFAAGSAFSTAKITDDSGVQQIEVHKNKDDYYAKSSAVDGAYKIAANLGADLSKSLDDFRNKRLFDFSYSDPDKIEIHDGTKTYSLTRKDMDWSLGSKKIDAASAETLVGKLRELTASRFVDSGFTTSALDVTVTYADGKRMEKVLISKNGNDCVAQRVNETTLYALDASSVEGIEKAAGDLKTADAAKK